MRHNLSNNFLVLQDTEIKILQHVRYWIEKNFSR